VDAFPAHRPVIGPGRQSTQHMYGTGAYLPVSYTKWAFRQNVIALINYLRGLQKKKTKKLDFCATPCYYLLQNTVLT